MLRKQRSADLKKNLKKEIRLFGMRNEKLAGGKRLSIERDS
jgi:hypothetical protein